MHDRNENPKQRRWLLQRSFSKRQQLIASICFIGIFVLGIGLYYYAQSKNTPQSMINGFDLSKMVRPGEREGFETGILDLPCGQIYFCVEDSPMHPEFSLISPISGAFDFSYSYYSENFIILQQTSRGWQLVPLKEGAIINANTRGLQPYMLQEQLTAGVYRYVTHAWTDDMAREATTHTIWAEFVIDPEAEKQVAIIIPYGYPENRGGKHMTVEDLLTLAAKGENLLLDDLAQYSYENFSPDCKSLVLGYGIAGLYRLMVEIDSERSDDISFEGMMVNRALFIQSTALYRIQDGYDNHDMVDIRTGNVEEFLRDHPAHPRVFAPGMPAYLPRNKLSTGYSLENAITDNCVVFVNSDLAYGQSIWQRFLSLVRTGWNSSIRLARYVTVDWNGYYEGYYEFWINNDSTLHPLDLTYVDGVFQLVDINGNGEVRHTSWLYMLCLDDSSAISSENYDRSVRYILTNLNDESVLREQLLPGSRVPFRGYDHFDGELMPQVPFRTVYTSYRYK